MIKPVLLWEVFSAALRSRSVEQFYDRISPVYDQVFVKHKVHADNMASILCQVYSGRETTTRVLDLGCGTGLLSCTLSDKGFEVIGVDVSLDSLHLLQKQNPAIKTIHGEAGSIPLGTGSCQSVVSLGAWRHFSDPQNVVAEIVRVLNNDGMFIVGYFPPALGGLLHLGNGAWRIMLDRLYQLLTRKLGYSDRTDLSLEPQTIRLLRKKFANVSTVDSGKRWRLIVASNL